MADRLMLSSYGLPRPRLAVGYFGFYWCLAGILAISDDVKHWAA
jgi:hypothetical protein